jgi:hypothetical protein
MRQASGSWGCMLWPRCAVGQGSVRSPGSPEASRAFQVAGKALDIPSDRAHKACEESGGVLVALHNIHSPGDARHLSGGVAHPVRPTRR